MLSSKFSVTWVYIVKQSVTINTSNDGAYKPNAKKNRSVEIRNIEGMGPKVLDGQLYSITRVKI